jgi:capsular exopolysaccharide synthesis family protein
MEYDQIKELFKSQPNSGNKNYAEIINAILKRKFFIIISFIIIIAAGYVYLKTATPIYESTVLIKMRGGNDKQNNYRDDNNSLVAFQSQDDITTEMALITTRNVLDKVVSKLNLNLFINKIVTPDGKTDEIESSLLEYNKSLSSPENSQMPQILNFSVISLESSYRMVLKNDNSGRFILYKIEDKVSTPVASFPVSNPIDITTSDFKLTVYWPKLQTGSELYFTVYDNADMADLLTSRIKVSQQENTSLINISVRDKNPQMAQILANTLVNNFMESRTAQQRQSIQGSYASIDSQLTETSKKLKDAENTLSNYQSQTGITNLDKNSTDIVDFLSSLEREKVNNDLILSQYQEKENQLTKVYDKKGYFDQSYLSPSENNAGGGDNAFSSLMTQLSALEVKRIELLQKETESHPDIISIDNQIAQIKKQLSSYNQNTLTAYRIIINSLLEKKKNLENLIAQYQGKIQGLPGKETKLAGLMRDKDVYSKVFNLLLDKREELRVKEFAQFQDIVVVDRAVLPDTPISPKRNLIAVLCLFLWGGLVLAYVFIGVSREKKLFKLDEIEEELQLPMLAIIPKFSKKLLKQIKKSDTLEKRFSILTSDNAGIKESFKVLQTRLMLASTNKSKLLMFTSCEEHSGKTTIVANLALSLVASGKKVLIIDADLKRCTLSDMFNIPRDLPGLSTFLKRELKTPPIMSLPNFTDKSSKEKLLSILPAGGVTEESSDLFQSNLTISLINALQSSTFDYILIDTPPVTRVIDSVILGTLVNNAVMIVRYNYSIRESVYSGVKELLKEKVSIVGVVANACDIEKSSYKHKYGYGYGYKYAYEPDDYSKKKKKGINQIAAM